jgi:hypothetical protein
LGRLRRAACRRDQRRPRLLFLVSLWLPSGRRTGPATWTTAASPWTAAGIDTPPATAAALRVSVVERRQPDRAPAHPSRWPSSSRIAACASVSPALPSRYRACRWALHRQPANQGRPMRKLAQCIVRSFETASWIRAPHATLPGKPLPAAVDRATADEPLSC